VFSIRNDIDANGLAASAVQIRPEIILAREEVRSTVQQFPDYSKHKKAKILNFSESFAIVKQLLTNKSSC